MLYLNQCQMPEEAWAAVLSALSSCKQKKDLRLNNNTIGAAGAHLAESIRAWGPEPCLRELSFDGCTISEETCEAVLSALSTCKHLTELYLSDNAVNGVVFSPFKCDCWCKIPVILNVHVRCIQ